MKTNPDSRSHCLCSEIEGTYYLRTIFPVPGSTKLWYGKVDVLEYLVKAT
jgi:hypothetical protein